MAHNFDDLCLASATNLSVQTVEEVQAATNELPSPTLVTNAVSPEIVAIEGRPSWDSITDETAGCVGVHAE